MPSNLWCKFCNFLLSSKQQFLLATHLYSQASVQNLLLRYPRTEEQDFVVKIHWVQLRTEFCPCPYMLTFFPHITLQVKTMAELASRGRKQKTTRHPCNMKQLLPKMVPSAIRMQPFITRGLLQTLGPQPQSLSLSPASTVFVNVVKSLTKPSAGIVAGCANGSSNSLLCHPRSPDSSN